MADRLDYAEYIPDPMDVAQHSPISRRCALASSRNAAWSSPAYSDAQPICGIGTRSPIHICQVVSSRSTIFTGDDAVALVMAKPPPSPTGRAESSIAPLMPGEGEAPSSGASVPGKTKTRRYGAASALGPNGVTGCSHGRRDGAAKPADADPVQRFGVSVATARRRCLR